MEILVGIGIFFSVVLLIEGIYSVIRTARNPERKEVKARLKRISSIAFEDAPIDIQRKKVLSKIPWFNRLLLSLGWTDRLNLLLRQADVKHPLGVFVLLSIFLAFVGLLGGSRLTSNYLIIIPLTVILGLIPLFYLLLKKKRRMDKFQQQFPDALDLIARALKAGHAFASGLKMVADEMSEPLGTEFDTTFHEINFGVDLADALKNLSNRVDCPDLKLFIISIILQRETGGNLVETLENIAYLIRERFKLQGRIRVLASQGKLSATILVVLPFAVALGFYILNRKYIEVMTTDPAGRFIILLALILMVIGILVMKKMVDIKV